MSAKKPVLIWLGICIFLIFMTVIVGGITRLTGSGLSIVKWQPVAGILPPLSTVEWQGLLEQYRQTPQYQIHNQGMSLSEFKFIFFWEYLHRILGRLVGLALFLPLVWFTIHKYFSSKELLHYYALVVLCGLQGALGWYMVQSGLIDIPMVSHLRLAAHLSLALILMCLLLWKFLNLLADNSPHIKYEQIPSNANRYFYISIFLLILVFTQIVWGAFTAGLRAGYIFNTFPLMSGYLIPPNMFELSGFFNNLINNSIAVQFVHRLLGWLLLLYAVGSTILVKSSNLPKTVKLISYILTLFILMQFCLGVATLLTKVNIALAVIHQGFAAVVLATACVFVWLFKSLRHI